MERFEILEEAKKCISGKREGDPGEQENTMELISMFWNLYLKEAYKSRPFELEDYDADAMMCLMKIARIATGYGNKDNWIDLAGYAALGGEHFSKLK